MHESDLAITSNSYVLQHPWPAGSPRRLITQPAGRDCFRVGYSIKPAPRYAPRRNDLLPLRSPVGIFKRYSDISPRPSGGKIQVQNKRLHNLLHLLGSSWSEQYIYRVKLMWRSTSKAKDEVNHNQQLNSALFKPLFRIKAPHFTTSLSKPR